MVAIENTHVMKVDFGLYLTPLRRSTMFPARRMAADESMRTRSDC
jgi:hypothetical protein